MRSGHSQERGDEGRPVSQAFNDAQRARQSDVFIQPDGRYVVRGIGGREHIFEPTGELVTSFIRSDKAHRSRIGRGERRSSNASEFAAFQEIFK